MAENDIGCDDETKRSDMGSKLECKESLEGTGDYRDDEYRKGDLKLVHGGWGPDGAPWQPPHPNPSVGP